MKKYFIATSLALIASQALSMPPKSNKDTEMREVAKQQQLDSNEPQSFLIYKVDASNVQDAIKNARNNLVNVAYQKGRAAVPELDLWYCEYANPAMINYDAPEEQLTGRQPKEHYEAEECSDEASTTSLLV